MTFGVPITCPVCGGALALENSTVTGTTRSVSILSCGPCKASFSVEAIMRRIPGRARGDSWGR